MNTDNTKPNRCPSDGAASFYPDQPAAQHVPEREEPPMSSELIEWVDDKARELMGGRDLHYGGFRDAAQWLAVRLAQSQKECSRLIRQINDQHQELSSLRSQQEKTKRDLVLSVLSFLSETNCTNLVLEDGQWFHDHDEDREYPIPEEDIAKAFLKSQTTSNG